VNQAHESQQNVAKLTQTLSSQEIILREVSAFDNQKREFERLIVLLNNEKAVLKSENQRLNDVVTMKSSELVTFENKWHEIRRNM
jgi:2-C-methyl-D-erythritol 4-phosphate cytidylyltransferase